MITNAEITIFNRFSDEESKKFIYIPHYVAPVWFYRNQKISVVDGGMISAEAFQIRIPRRVCEGWSHRKNLTHHRIRWEDGPCRMMICLSWDSGMAVCG